MAIYNFKKELKLYIVRNGLRYRLDIYPDVSFSQTVSETSVPVKTLHTQTNMFESASITRANPANFEFTIPFLYETDLDIVFQQLLDYDSSSVEATVKTADLYVEMNSETYKLEMAVIESGVFRIVRNELMVLNVSGTASKLTKYVGALPGTLQTRSATMTMAAPTSLEVKIGGVTKTNISSVSLEVKNAVEWIDFTTLQNSLTVFSASGTMYPGAFVVQNRTLSGSIEGYVTDATAAAPVDWEIGQSLSIKAGTTSASLLLTVSVPQAVYTKRTQLQDLLMHSYDWRMISNPASLSTVIQY